MQSSQSSTERKKTDNFEAYMASLATEYKIDNKKPLDQLNDILNKGLFNRNSEEKNALNFSLSESKIYQTEINPDTSSLVKAFNLINANNIKNKTEESSKKEIVDLKSIDSKALKEINEVIDELEQSLTRTTGWKNYWDKMQKAHPNMVFEQLKRNVLNAFIFNITQTLSSNLSKKKLLGDNIKKLKIITAISSQRLREAEEKEKIITKAIKILQEYRKKDLSIIKEEILSNLEKKLKSYIQNSTQENYLEFLSYVGLSQQMVQQNFSSFFKKDLLESNLGTIIGEQKVSKFSSDKVKQEYAKILTEKQNSLKENAKKHEEFIQERLEKLNEKTKSESLDVINKIANTVLSIRKLYEKAKNNKHGPYYLDRLQAMDTIEKNLLESLYKFDPTDPRGIFKLGEEVLNSLEREIQGSELKDQVSKAKNAILAMLNKESNALQVLRQNLTNLSDSLLESYGILNIIENRKKPEDIESFVCDLEKKYNSTTSETDKKTSGIILNAFYDAFPITLKLDHNKERQGLAAQLEFNSRMTPDKPKDFSSSFKT